MTTTREALDDALGSLATATSDVEDAMRSLDDPDTDPGPEEIVVALRRVREELRAGTMAYPEVRGRVLAEVEAALPRPRAGAPR